MQISEEMRDGTVEGGGGRGRTDALAGYWKQMEHRIVSEAGKIESEKGGREGR